MRFGGSGDDLPDFLKHILGHIEPSEDINPELPITMYPDAVDIPLFSRVTLTPDARKVFSVPKEPDYGVLVYKSSMVMLFPNENNPAHSPEYWDCVIAVTPDASEPQRVVLYPFHSSQLRIPKDDNVDVNEFLDNYRLPLGRQFMVGDEITINPNTPDSAHIRFPQYPCKAIVTDVFAGVSFMGKNISSSLRQVDLTLRCVVNNDGLCRTFYGFSGNFMLYSEAEAANSNN